MREFDFLAPRSLQDALAMLADLGGEAVVFAGGTALMLGMRQRMLAPRALVSLGGLDELRAITFDARNGLRIGAMARHSDVARSEEVRRHYPMLAAMAARLANPQVRNQGTIGGNLCYADPSTDPPSCLVALDAEVTVAGRDGERRMKMQEFSTDFFATALRPGEVLTEIRLPPPHADARGFYRRQLRTAAEHRPVANVAMTLRAAGKRWSGLRIVVGAATPVPQRMARAEDYLEGRTVTLADAEATAQIVAEDLVPLSDGRAGADFRRAIVRAATRRLVAEAAGLNWQERAA